MSDLDRELRRYFDDLAAQLPNGPSPSRPRRAGRSVVLAKRGLPLLVVPLVGVPLYLGLSGGHTAAPGALPISTSSPCQPSAIAVTLPPTVRTEASQSTTATQKATPAVTPGYYVAAGSNAIIVVGIRNISAAACSEPLLPHVDAHLGSTPASLLPVNTPEASALPAAIDLAPGQQDLLTLSLDTTGSACVSQPGPLTSLTIHLGDATATTPVVAGLTAGSSCTMHQLPLVAENPSVTSPGTVVVSTPPSPA